MDTSIKIYEAASSNDVTFVKEALAGSCDDIPNSDLELALLRAACNGHTECLDLLLDASVSVSAKDGSEDTALILAAEQGHEDVVRRLIERGCPVNYQNSLGYTALMKACEFGHVGVAQMLLKGGTDESGPVRRLDNRNDPGRAKGLDRRLQCDLPHGYTALMVTVLNKALGYQALVRLLLEAGVDVNEEDLEGCTVLHHAAKHCDSEALKLLLDANAEVNYMDIWRVTPLMNACAYNRVDSVKLLLQYGADVKAVCQAKRSCLSIAARRACAEIIGMLLAAGADPNHLDAHENTPLYVAMVHQNYAAMICLLQIGCDLSIKCSEITKWQKFSYMEYAIFKKDTHMIHMLHRAGACSNKNLYSFSQSEKYANHCADKPEVFETLHELATLPRSLMSSCRLAVRGAIQQSLPTGIQQLSLPTFLRDYLFFPDMTMVHAQ